MIIYKAEEISCGHCVARIEKALSEAGITHKVELDQKTVGIEGDESVQKQAVELLDDLGFTAVPV